MTVHMETETIREEGHVTLAEAQERPGICYVYRNRYRNNILNAIYYGTLPDNRYILAIIDRFKINYSAIVMLEGTSGKTLFKTSPDLRYLGVTQADLFDALLTWVCRAVYLVKLRQDKYFER